MNDIGILKAADHVDNGVHLTDVGQELVAQALSFGRAFDQTRYIHEFNHRGGDLFGIVHLSQQLNSLIRYRYDTDIGVDGAERIVGRFRARLGQ